MASSWYRVHLVHGNALPWEFNRKCHRSHRRAFGHIDAYPALSHPTISIHVFSPDNQFLAFVAEDRKITIKHISHIIVTFVYCWLLPAIIFPNRIPSLYLVCTPHSRNQKFARSMKARSTRGCGCITDSSNHLVSGYNPPCTY